MSTTIKFGVLAALVITLIAIAAVSILPAAYQPAIIITAALAHIATMIGYYVVFLRPQRNHN